MRLLRQLGRLDEFLRESRAPRRFPKEIWRLFRGSRRSLEHLEDLRDLLEESETVDNWRGHLWESKDLDDFLRGLGNILKHLGNFLGDLKGFRNLQSFLDHLKTRGFSEYLGDLLNNPEYSDFSEDLENAQVVVSCGVNNRCLSEADCSDRTAPNNHCIRVKLVFFKEHNRLFNLGPEKEQWIYFCAME